MPNQDARNKLMIELVNKFQDWCENTNLGHPLTCGGPCDHSSLKPKEENGNVILYCPNCDYIQNDIPDIIFKIVTNKILNWKKEHWESNRNFFSNIDGYDKLVCESCGNEFNKDADGKYIGVIFVGCSCCGRKFCEVCYNQHYKCFRCNLGMLRFQRSSENEVLVFQCDQCKYIATSKELEFLGFKN